MYKEREVRRSQRERGQDLVEFALIAPILFAVLFGIVEFGVAVWRYNTVSNAAREGARQAIVYPEAEREAQAMSAATSFARSVGLDISDDDVTYELGAFVIGEGENAKTLDTAVVTVTYTHTGITGFFIPYFREIPMSASSSMLTEQQR